jgi:hypothetical protein
LWGPFSFDQIVEVFRNNFLRFYPVIVI